MAKDKERLINPAQAQRNQEKQRALKKGKAEIQARRNEKLARRNPFRLQRQIDELRAVEEAGQPLNARDKRILEELQRDLAAVNRAREALGDRAPRYEERGGQGRQQRDRDAGGAGRKRRRDERDDNVHRESSEETDEDVRRIPMPRDTPPPIPRSHQQRQHRAGAEGPSESQHTAPEPAPPRTVYESAPMVRDLRKEAAAFVPAAVRAKLAAKRGDLPGKLLEPEEADKLEKAGYYRHGDDAAAKSVPSNLEDEEERFEREMRTVELEEVPDEDQ